MKNARVYICCIAILMAMLMIMSACASTTEAHNASDLSGSEAYQAASGPEYSVPGESADLSPTAEPAVTAESGTPEAAGAQMPAHPSASPLNSSAVIVPSPASSAKASASDATGTNNNTPSTNNDNEPATRRTSTPDSAPTAVRTASPTAAPIKKEDAVVRVYGSGVTAEKSFTLSEIKAMSDIALTATYYSRGKEPYPELETEFEGIRVYEFLANYVGLSSSAKKVTFNCTDGYSQTYSIKQTKAKYIDETDPSKTLYMILAWKEDGSWLTPESNPLRLVMGQVVEGEYNRTYWASNVCDIKVS